MKTIFLITLFFATICCQAQTLSEKPEPAPPYIYIMPDLSRTQIDSAIQHLKQWNIELNFETLEYDPATDMIVSASGTVVNRNFPKNVSKATFNSDEFKGLTIITTKERTGIAVGILPLSENK